MTATLTLAESVAGAVRDAIVRGDYLSGDRLVELALASEMNVSQNTVREALRLLEQEGWVVKYPRRGVYVRSFTADEAAEVCALLAAVEQVALGYIIASMTRARLTDLRRMIETARKHLLTGDRERTVELMFAFHDALGATTGRDLTTDMLSRLRNKLRLLEMLRRARQPGSVEALMQQLDQQTDLLDAIGARDHAAATAILHAQITTYREALLRVL